MEAGSPSGSFQNNRPFPYSNPTDPPTPCQGEPVNASLRFYAFYMRGNSGRISSHTYGACDSYPFQGAEGVFEKTNKLAIPACQPNKLTPFRKLEVPSGASSSFWTGTSSPEGSGQACATSGSSRIKKTGHLAQIPIATNYGRVFL